MLIILHNLTADPDITAKGIANKTTVKTKHTVEDFCMAFMTIYNGFYGRVRVLLFSFALRI